MRGGRCECPAAGGGVRAKYVTRRVRGYPRDKGDFGWRMFETRATVLADAVVAGKA